MENSLDLQTHWIGEYLISELQKRFMNEKDTMMLQIILTQESQTFEQLANKFGISKERIRQIYAKIERQLKKPSNHYWIEKIIERLNKEISIDKPYLFISNSPVSPVILRIVVGSVSEFKVSKMNDGRIIIYEQNYYSHFIEKMQEEFSNKSYCKITLPYIYKNYAPSEFIFDGYYVKKPYGYLMLKADSEGKITLDDQLVKKFLIYSESILELEYYQVGLKENFSKYLNLNLLRNHYSTRNLLMRYVKKSMQVNKWISQNSN